MITVKNLSKNFTVYKKEAGLKGSLMGLFYREATVKKALINVNMTITPGEIIGLIGANGAGKTTLVKILAGIIYPDDGHVSVLGFDPWKRSNELRRQVALIMGQKAQLWWDLPAMDSFQLLKEIYQIPTADFNKSIDFLADVLQVKDQLNIQIRKLSLGERMKVELMGALLHHPKVIYLDEPTIGLDLMAQRAVREFIKAYQTEFKPMILLTSHYMEDIKTLCPRVAMIRHGEIIYDGSLSKILKNNGEDKLISIQIDPKNFPWEKMKSQFPKAQRLVESEVSLSVPKGKLASTISELLETYAIQDFVVSEPSIDVVIEKILKGEE
jgi:ABC-2 type transport system ATP-binding protein